jgi:hypothetical protein
MLTADSTDRMGITAEVIVSAEQLSDSAESSLTLASVWLNHQA